jgi:hypothetical protein
LIPYWLLFGYFLFGAMLTNTTATGRQPTLAPMVVGAIAMAVMIGFRYEVGADWRTYDLLFKLAGLLDLQRVMQIGDPGYQFLNWLIERIGGGLWTVNLVCAGFSAGGCCVSRESRTDPWLAFVIAIPYLVIVVAMGYTRQGWRSGLSWRAGQPPKGGDLTKFAIYVSRGMFHRPRFRFFLGRFRRR